MTIYLVQLDSGQYGLLTKTGVYLLDPSYSIEYLQNHFGLALTIF